MLLIKKNVVSAYMIDSVSLWHGRLAHIGIGTMKRMVKCGLIECDVKNFNKCEIFTKSKMIKKSIVLRGVLIC